MTLKEELKELFVVCIFLADDNYLLIETLLLLKYEVLNKYKPFYDTELTSLTTYIYGIDEETVVENFQTLPLSLPKLW